MAYKSCVSSPVLSLCVAPFDCCLLPLYLLLLHVMPSMTPCHDIRLFTSHCRGASHERQTLHIYVAKRPPRKRGAFSLAPVSARYPVVNSFAWGLARSPVAPSLSAAEEGDTSEKNSRANFMIGRWLFSCHPVVSGQQTIFSPTTTGAFPRRYHINLR